VARRPAASIESASSNEEVAVTQASQEHSQHHCPDPTKPFKDYLIDSAVAKKTSDLYADDVKVVQPRYDKLKGAQTRYADAKKAQQNAFQELKQRLHRIKENLHCSLKDSERDELINCWRELLDETRPPYDSVNCRPIDSQDPCDLPEGRPALTDLLAAAVKCASRADQRFDWLIKLPDDLPTTISGLADRATALEQAVVTATKEQLRRDYVEYLELHKDFEALEAEWTDPTQYGCKLKRIFWALLKRHILVIAISAAIERLDQYDAREEAEKEEKKNNLIDFVLECAAPEPGKDQGSQAGGYTESESSKQTREQTAEQSAPTRQPSTSDEEEV